MWFVAIIMKVIGFFGGANFGTLITGVTDVLKNNTNAEVINNKTGAELGVQYLQAVNETNKIKAERQTERQVIWGLFGFALPTMVIWWLALLDGIPFYFGWFMVAPHVQGSWAIAIPPDFKTAFLTIVQSFFIAAPSLAGVAMLARAFKK